MGIRDVRAWMTTDEARGILNYWAAVDRVWCLPDPWEQTAQLCYAIEQLRQTLLAVNGNEPKAIKRDDWMPGRYVAPKSIPAAPNGEEQARKLDAYVKRGK